MHRVLAAVETALALGLVVFYLHVLAADRMPGARFYDATVATAAGYILLSAAALVAGRDIQLLLFPLRDAVKFAVPWSWLGFAIHLTNHREDMTRRRWALLVGAGVVGVGIPVTDPVHGLAYPGVVPGYHGQLRPIRGPAFWGHFALMHAVYGVAVALMLVHLFSTEYVDTGTATVVTVVLFVVTPLDLVNLLVVEPRVGVVVLPPLLAVFGTLVTSAVDRYDLLRVAPVSRRATLDATDDAIVVVRRGMLLDHNAAAAPFVTDDALGKPFPEVVREEVRSLFPDEVWGGDASDPGPGPDDPVSDGALEPGEIAVEIDGERRYFDPKVTSPAPNAAVLVLRDVTALKRKERELERKNERLETFTGTVAHDLRNPIAVAKGYLDVASDDDAVHKAEDAVDRMEAMVEDLLELARQGRTVGETEPVDIRTAAREAWAAVDTADATLAVETDRHVAADPDRLGNLLENLVRNAVEHGGADVTVTVDATDDGFSVADDGPGIPESERDDVFDHGYTTRDEGTGFGLSIVGEIAAAHGWDVTVGESEAGGARFEFRGVDVVDAERT